MNTLHGRHALVIEWGKIKTTLSRTKHLISRLVRWVFNQLTMFWKRLNRSVHVTQVLLTESESFDIVHVGAAP